MDAKIEQKVSPAESSKSKRLIVREKYDAVQKAVLEMLPLGGEAVTCAELAEMIAPQLPESLFRRIGTVRWYTRVVQLDLETEGVIERVPGSKPLRLRRLA